MIKGMKKYKVQDGILITKNECTEVAKKNASE